MVDNVRLIPETLPPEPFPTGDARKTVGPIYDLPVIQKLLSGDAIITVTKDAENNIEDLEWDFDDVALVIKAMLKTDYRNSEWCQARGGKKLDADVYVVPYDHKSESRNLRSGRYYIKFAFLNDKVHLALISCHVS